MCCFHHSASPPFFFLHIFVMITGKKKRGTRKKQVNAVVLLPLCSNHETSSLVFFSVFVCLFVCIVTGGWRRHIKKKHKTQPKEESVERVRRKETIKKCCSFYVAIRKHTQPMCVCVCAGRWLAVMAFSLLPRVTLTSLS
jgi:hypothetical protein